MIMSEPTPGSEAKATTTTAPAVSGAIAFPTSLASEMAALESMASSTVMTTPTMSGFAGVPFDEQLISMPTELAQQQHHHQHQVTDPVQALMAAANGNPASFFVDTAALAQQMAGLVQDEKKLSDNILDLIPPPQPNVTSAPLAPPSDLLAMRALSPPMSLLPELSHHPIVMPPLSLDATAPTTTIATSTPASTTAPLTTSSSAATIATTIPTTTIAKPIPTTTTPTILTEDNKRKATAAYATAALLKKRKSDIGVSSSLTSLPTTMTTTTVVAPSTSTLVQQPTTTMTTTNAAAAAAAVAASNLQTLAREKVMKEPQSGDLYECVITKRNGGLGLTLACVDDHVQITGLAPDTPAANSGICVGDTLVAVSGLPVRGLQFSTVIGRLKSSSRNSVVLKLRRNPFRHTVNGNGSGHHPYRSAAASAVNGSALKRPTPPSSSSISSARPLTKPTSESNSANVLLTASKSIALESRLAGGGTTTSSSVTETFQVKTEPTQTAYFPTDASILTMSTAMPTSSVQPVTASVPPITATTANLTTTTVPPVPAWRVAEDERDRYYVETRRLRRELAQSLAWRRRERSAKDALYDQFQQIAQSFEREMQTIFQIGANKLEPTPTTSTPTTTTTTATPTTTTNNTTPTMTKQPTPTMTSHHEDLVALRQKLLQVNHALARQQTEILELKERDARHAFHEARRIQSEVIREIQRHMAEMAMASSRSTTTPTTTSAYTARVDAVRPSVFELLFDQPLKQKHPRNGSSTIKTTALSSSTTIVQGKTKQHETIELDVDLATTSQILNWNLRETQPVRQLVMELASGLRVEYATHEETLTLHYQLRLMETKP